MSGSLLLGQLDHQVVIEADDECVTKRVSRSFREMLKSSRSGPYELLEVRRGERGHELRRNGVEVFNDVELSEVQRALRHEIIQSFVRARPDLLWLHAGAAVLNGRALLFVAPYGRGKSTLVTQLCARGFSYASDDIVPVDLSSGRILPFPLTPFVRENIDTELPGDRVAELRKYPVSLPPSAFLTDPVLIGAIVLPTYRVGSIARLEPYSPAAAALDIMRQVINSGRHGEATVALCSRLVTQVPILPLVFSDAGAAADLIIEEVGQPPSQHPSTDRPNADSYQYPASFALSSRLVAGPTTTH